jgi:hypothetical protein
MFLSSSSFLICVKQGQYLRTFILAKHSIFSIFYIYCPLTSVWECSIFRMRIGCIKKQAIISGTTSKWPDTTSDASNIHLICCFDVMLWCSCLELFVISELFLHFDKSGWKLISPVGLNYRYMGCVFIVEFLWFKNWSCWGEFYMGSELHGYGLWWVEILWVVGARLLYKFGHVIIHIGCHISASWLLCQRHAAAMSVPRGSHVICHVAATSSNSSLWVMWQVNPWWSLSS